MRSNMLDAVDRYVENLSANTGYSLRGLEFVMDTANGAAFKAAPQLFESLGATVEVGRPQGRTPGQGDDERAQQ